ncbi:MFS transporter [Nitrospirillum amazonense]|uniref:MFS transporter n=1 Tax=Nitrospirillum amazonense TaxID=28077 RepID=UPI002412DD36|nr:MFS transporter [Nitrospirillum amazonense]MDG3443344.1 MFS transporter [Nitrospirillum amazonense]
MGVTPAGAGRDRWSQVMTVVRVASGNFLEMYDFMVFGYFAGAISRAYFPKGSDTAGLLLTFATFGAGFLMRPIGALALGAYIDRKGRRDGLLLTLGLMSVGTITIALMPGYATIGLLSPLLVLLGRLVQGLSAGVELGGVSVYLSEIATPGRKGFYVSWQSASQQVAVMVAALIGVALTFYLPPDTMQAWGWRIPLVVGCLIVPFLFQIRRSLTETEVFLARKHRPTVGEILASLAANWGVVLTGVGLVLMTTVSFYFITAYTPTFGRDALHLSDMDALLVTLAVGASNLAWLPLSGALSDRIGRRPILVACTVLALATAYPALSWLADAPSFGRLLGVELWLSFLYACYNGAMVVYLTEIVPTAVRTAGFSLAYSLATAAGGFTPFVSTYLVKHGGNAAMPGLWLSAAAFCGLVAVPVSARFAKRHAEG